MGYDYAPMPTPWHNFKPIRKTTTGKVNTDSLPHAIKVFPLAKLDRAICFSINRPASSRTSQEKNEQEEMLAFNHVKYDDSKNIRFDVFLSVDELDKTEAKIKELKFEGKKIKDHPKIGTFVRMSPKSFSPLLLLKR
ncbi:hypothetical protein RND71_042598 [Anisodus tanguticus]|uniref:Polyphenol oxidase C-terminal domain-containing protein n=1 Tax=Anisodus tanguticus TaxID=243964 RepID=A0AAE1USF3_9SOLA|nr:hypothetical protein RND71_042598 [Anisodus tanguticus]